MNQAPTNKSNLYIKNVGLINQINKLKKCGLDESSPYKKDKPLVLYKVN